MLASLVETGRLVQQIAVIDKRRDAVRRHIEKRAEGISRPAQHPQILERERQVVLDACDIGPFETAFIRLRRDFQKAAAMPDTFPVLLEVRMRRAKGEM